jgi:hypothetical protein
MECVQEQCHPFPLPHMQLQSINLCIGSVWAASRGDILKNRASNKPGFSMKLPKGVWDVFFFLEVGSVCDSTGISVRWHGSMYVQSLLQKIPEELVAGRIWESASHTNDCNSCILLQNATRRFRCYAEEQLGEGAQEPMPKAPTRFNNTCLFD